MEFHERCYFEPGNKFKKIAHSSPTIFEEPSSIPIDEDL